MIKWLELEVYKTALEIGDIVWKMVNGWDAFNKETLGKQFVNAADSIALNTAEGYGRYHFKENKNFNYYARGSAFESTACLRKGHKRGLVSDVENTQLRQLFEKYFRLVNGYINSIGKSPTPGQFEEDETNYSVNKDNLDSYLSNDQISNDQIANDH